MSMSYRQRGPAAPPPPTQLQVLQEILARLTNMPGVLRQSLIDHQWSRIPLFIDESNYALSQAIGAPLVVAPQTNGGLELITSIIASVPAGATGIIQLGLQQIPVGAGTTVITPVQKLMNSTDTRSLTLAGAAGPAMLWLTGEQMPTNGSLAQ